MTPGRRVIWLGDLIRAFEALAPADGQTRDAIAEFLGFEGVVTAPAATIRASTPSPPAAVPPPAAPPAAPAVPLLDRIRRLTPRLAAAQEPASIEPLRLTASTTDGPVPASPPLLSPLAARFIVNELVSTLRFGPEPDVDRLVTVLAGGDIPDPLPLQEHRTLARGVQVLVDRGEGMEPFAGDQTDLQRLLSLLVGTALMDVRPIHEVPDEADPSVPWAPPPPGTPVLVLTDFGLSGRADRDPATLLSAWRRTAMLLASRGSSLIALVPYPKERWPAVGDAIRLVVWDRETTAAGARAARQAAAPR
jgi:hypothetical protein